MSGEESLLAFAGLMLVAQFSPGPDMILLMRNALLHSRAAALLTVCGISLGLCVHCALILGGVAVLLKGSPLAFTLLRALGVLYLGWLGSRMIWSVRSGGGGAAPVAGPALGGAEAFLQGLFTNLLNAKAVLFLLAALSAFLPAHAPPWRPWALGAIVVGQALVFWSLFVLALRWSPVRQFFTRRARAMHGLFGGLLILTAIAGLVSLLRVV